MDTNLIKVALEDTINLTSCNCPNNKCDGTCTYSKAKRALKELDKTTTDMPKLLIFIEGGIIQGSFSNKNIMVKVLDLDLEDLEDSEIQSYLNRSGSEDKAYIHTHEADDREDMWIEKDPEFVNRLFKTN